MATLYKILFEVRLMHEFYLTDPDGSSVFDKTAQPDRLSFLLQRFNLDIPSINNDLSFEVPAAFSDSFKSHRLHLVTTDSGFEVLAEVTQQVLSNGTTVYTPLVPLPDDYAITVLLTRNDNNIDRVTSSRSQRNIDTVYFFSNEKLYEAKTAPFLSSPILPENTSYAYEQGELSKDGAGHVQSFYFDGSNQKTWQPVSGTDFANERDRLVVPPVFYYNFNPGDNVQHAVFQLQDSLHQTIQTIKSDSAAPLKTVFLDFSTALVNSLPSAAMTDPILYTLHVTGDNSYSADHDIIFYPDEAGLDECWGIVRTGIRVSNTAYNLLDTNGYLQTRIQSGATTPDPYPVFEIGIKSKFTYWRYVSNLGLDKKLALSSVTTNLLNNNSGKLESQAPRALTYIPTYFKKTQDNTTPLLPNPGINAVNKKEQQKIFTEIRVPDSALFPGA